MALARRRAARKANPSLKRRRRKRADLVDVVASRSFLVDIHLLNPRD